MAVAADRNLLFGILALQMDFITRDQLVAAMHAWLLDKAKPLGRILVEQKALRENQHNALEAMMQVHVEAHNNDPQQSLASLSSVGSARQVLDQIADPDVQASLAHFDRQFLKGLVADENLLAVADRPTIAPPSVHGAEDAGATKSYSVGESTSAGERFRILRPHAEGGLGRVSVARDEELGRDVALKEIKERYADDPASRSRFLLEAEITGGLEHPGIVPVYGLGSYADGRPFYAMRFIRGDSLKEAIEVFHQGNRRASSRKADVTSDATGHVGLTARRSPDFTSLDFRKLLGRFNDVCNAIAYAHSRGVLHRDLKPGNIMLGKYGETLVVDWGLGKLVERTETDAQARDAAEQTLKPASGSGSVETIAGQALGTPAYMSPEQAAGRLDLLGPASDVYSLGATLYSVLTGRAPFEGSDIGVMLANVQMGEFPKPRQVQPGIDPALEAICMKAMATKSEDRYDTARLLADDIEHWLADEPVSAHGEPWPVRAGRWARKHQTLVAGAAAALVVAIFALVAGNLLLSRANSDLADANVTIKNREADALAELRRSQTLLYHSTFREAYHHFEKGDFVGVRAALDDCPRDLRGPEYGFLASYCRRRLRVVGAHEGPVLSLALSADGKRLFSGSEDQTIKVWDLQAGKETLTLRGHTDRVRSLALSADGMQLFSGSLDKTIKVWNLEAGTETLTLRGHTSEVMSLALSADGKRLFSGSWDQTIKVWDLETSKETLTLRGHTHGVMSLALSADGKRLYSGSWDKSIKLWDLELGTEKLTLRGHTSEVMSLALSADGKRLFSGSFNQIKVWDLDAGQETLTLRGHTNYVSSLALSADGKRLFSGNQERGKSGEIKVWNLEEGQETLTLRGHTDGIDSLALSADGKRLFSGSGDKSIKVWDLEAGKETLTLRGHTDGILSLALSADGKRLFSGSGYKTIKVWDLAPGEETLTLRDPATHVTSLAFSADGKRLFSGSFDKTVKVWDLEAGKEMLTLRGHTDPVSSLALSGDGKRLFSAGSFDKTIKVWDLEAGKEMLTLRGHTDAVSRLTLSADGKRLYSGSLSEIKEWDLEAGQETLTLRGYTDGIYSLTLSTDGKRLYSGSISEIKVWDVEAGKETLTLRGHTDGVHSLTLSTDGKRLFSGSSDQTIKVWDLEAGKETLTLRGHTDTVTSLALSADGKRLFSGSHDRTIKVWDLDAGEER